MPIGIPREKESGSIPIYVDITVHYNNSCCRLSLPLLSSSSCDQFNASDLSPCQPCARNVRKTVPTAELCASMNLRRSSTIFKNISLVVGRLSNCNFTITVYMQYRYAQRAVISSFGSSARARKPNVPLVFVVPVHFSHPAMILGQQE